MSRLANHEAGYAVPAQKKKGLLFSYRKHKYLALMFAPAVLYYVIFHYVPIYGVLIAFKDYKFSAGIWGSEWVGLMHFRDLFTLGSFWEVFRNTIIISTYKLIFGFPAPIALALLLNEVRLVFFKRAVQTITYMPHFLSWVIIAGLFVQFLSPSIGPINVVLISLGLKPIYFLADPAWFRSVLVITDIWKDVGWGTIVYLAALTSISPELYEASKVDGANRFQNTIYITLPSLTPVITIMFIFAVGRLVNDDFDQVFNMYNSAVYSVGDVLSTYTYRKGLVGMEYSFATAVGLFKNIVAFTLVVLTNAIAKRINDYGLW
ncbi:putative aldouronate transport system permease protein [Paenibacillus sp. UNCCL117]|uniref:ABC transporter permease n=1 Tax=unclassified Paenibacillus TaxID=185978 RepID=UPI00088AE5A2|nr:MULTISPECIES: ABC transporter permease subunit [unclassified Paenibacillus]SDE55933.1 putative aldouronate transport system permease protein [Paenibacillus sp. cl123]SFW66314.1 putative aldouronate transport system permease protein [Paenibacillus sp. UNCCL117]